MKTLEKQKFFGHWRYVHLRKCSQCQKIHRILGNNTKQRPSLPPGAIKCECGTIVKF